MDPRIFGTLSLRGTKAALIDRRTGNLRAVQLHEAGIYDGKIDGKFGERTKKAIEALAKVSAFEANPLNKSAGTPQ